VYIIGYEEFGALRFLDHFPETDHYFCDDVGGVTCCIGTACREGYGQTAFAWRVSGPKITSEIVLDFNDDCPAANGHALLDTIGLPLRCGMYSKDTLNVLGTLDPAAEAHPRFLRFIVGEEDNYYVFCAFDEADRLYRIGVARKDLTDAWQRRFAKPAD